MIVLSYDISKIKPCDLKTALDSIYLEFTPHPCKYNAIIEMAPGILWLAIFQLTWMFLNLFYVPYLFSLARIKERHRTLRIFVIVVSTFVHRSTFYIFYYLFCYVSPNIYVVFNVFVK